VAPLCGPGSLIGGTVTLGLKDAEGLFGEEDESALDPADYDPTPTTRAQPAAFGCRIQKHATVRAGCCVVPRRRPSLDRLVRHDGHRIWPRSVDGPRPNLRPLVWGIAAEQAPKEVDADLPNLLLAVQRKRTRRDLGLLRSRIAKA
jgi:hypothetical protein